MKCKAYVFANAADYDIEDISEKITFAETADKAKQDFSIENEIHFKDIRVQRLPWADKYGSVDNIPVEEWLNHGWYFNCDTCGAEIEDMADFHINNKGYCCKKCFDDWGERKVEETMVIMEKYYSEYDSPIISYVCGECGEKFLDRDDNYRFCPYCGRKITNTVN